MKYQVELLEPHIEAALFALAKITDLKICRVTLVEIEDTSPAAPIVSALLGTLPAIDLPAAPFLDPDPPPASKTTPRICADCGQPFEARRKDQRNCTRPECKQAARKAYMALYRSNHGSKSHPAPEVPKQETPLPPA